VVWLTYGPGQMFIVIGAALSIPIIPLIFGSP
jgi:hypothetical protein